MNATTEPDEMTPDEMRAHRAVYENAHRCMTFAVMAMGADIPRELFGALVAAERAWVLEDAQAKMELETWEFTVDAFQREHRTPKGPWGDPVNLAVEALGYILRSWDVHVEICRESRSGRYLDRYRAEEYLSDTFDWFGTWIQHYRQVTGTRMAWTRPPDGAGHGQTHH